MSVEVLYHHDNQWKSPVGIYGGHQGVWKEGISKLVASKGKWVEVFDAESIPDGLSVELDTVSYRGATAGQSDLNITGTNLSGSIAPRPTYYAFYPLVNNLADQFENFSNMTGNNVTGADFVGDATLSDGLLLKSANTEYTTFPVAEYDSRGLLGNDGKRYWMFCVRGYIQTYPSAGQVRYLMHTGVVGSRVGIGFNSDGKLFVSWDGAGTYKTYLFDTIILPLSGDGRFSISVEHNPGIVDEIAPKIIVKMSKQTTGPVYTNFSVEAEVDPSAYFIPDLGVPIYIGRGEMAGASVPATYLFSSATSGTGIVVDDNVGSYQQITYSSSTAAYQGAQPGGVMNPGTGKYYIRLTNNNTYDMHFGVAEPGANLQNAPGVSGWCMNTINGRSFNHQTGGGTTWSTAIPASSSIGLLYDSDLGCIEISVNGVSRGKPFPNGSITVPVKLIVGGRSNTTSQPMVIGAYWYSSDWIGDALSTGAAQVPPETIITPGDTVYVDAFVKNVVLRNAAMEGSWLNTFIDLASRFSLQWKNLSTLSVFDGTGYIVKQSENLISAMVPRELLANDFEITAQYGTTSVSNAKRLTINRFTANETGIDIDFSNTTEAEVDKHLMKAHKQWGGLNGGVIQENVYLDKHQGILVCNSQGDLYTGPLRGVNNKGEPTSMSTRMGGCAVTRDYFGPASYRVQAKLPILDGVVSAFWTFHYEEAYPGTPPYDEFLAEGLHTQGNEVSGFYVVRNHEIDIEIPTALKTDPDMEVVSYRNGRFNSWQGELRTWELPETDPEYWTEYTDDFINHGVQTNDGQFHEYRFDWHIHPTPKIEFYIDGVLKHTLTTTIPDIPGRFWFGLWFPSAVGNHWAGKTANWVEQRMEIRRLQIIPFALQQSYTRQLPESYPNDVFRTFLDDGTGERKDVL